MAAEENFVEVFASLGRLLVIQQDMRRVQKDYVFKISNRFKSSQRPLYCLCFSELTTTISLYIKEEYKKGEDLVVPIPGISAQMLFKLILDDSYSTDTLP